MGTVPRLDGPVSPNIAIFLFIGLLCLIITMVGPMRNRRPHTNPVLKLDMLAPYEVDGAAAVDGDRDYGGDADGDDDDDDDDSDDDGDADDDVAATIETFYQTRNVKRKSVVETVKETGLDEFLQENNNWTWADTMTSSSPETEQQQQQQQQQQPEKYVIYMCDGKVRCYGLADRERGITLAYLIALLTGRRFGMISTSPVPLEDYYVPNKIDWTISPSELEGKSSAEISLLGTRQTIGLSFIDFNKKYPQDVIYLRTNRDIGSINFYKNLQYRFRFKSWTLKTKRKIFSKIFIALMKPSNLLRRQLNTILVEIALTMKQESLIHSSLKTPSCQRTCEALKTNKNILWDQSEFNFLHKNADLCIKNLQSDIRKAPSTILKGENQETMLSLLSFKDENEEKSPEEEEERADGDEDSIPLLQDLCKTKPAINPNVSIDDIWASQGYDFLDLNLVCVHIRLGNSPTMPFEKGVRNTLEDCDGVWDFLRPYVEKGHHVFLASDAEQVRIKGKSIFGSKIHINEAPVIHIDKVKDWQDEREGMELALTEQLMLMTSCHTLVVSNSGFSQRAAMIRRQLLGIGRVYQFRKAVVQPWAVHF